MARRRPWVRCGRLLIAAALCAANARAVRAQCQPEWSEGFNVPGVSGGFGTSIVTALTMFDDGSGGGPALYVGGHFTIAGDVPANHIAKWDGTNWSALGSGVSSSSPGSTQVLALAVFDDGMGGGPALYAGGWFTSAGGVAANFIAKWDGKSWSNVGGGIMGEVRAMAVFSDPLLGPGLYVGGWFTLAGGVSANRIARWDGKSWSALGEGVDSAVQALTVFDDGLGGGPALYAGGYFDFAGGVLVNKIAKWNGVAWSPLGSGVDHSPGFGPTIFALTVFDDGSPTGEALYAGGSFAFAGGLPAHSIAKWDGVGWSEVGGGVGEKGLGGPAVLALSVYDNGSGGGPSLVAGGGFTSAGPLSVNQIAQWDGTSWSAMGSGVSSTVYSLLGLSDQVAGGISGLFAGGHFTAAGTAGASRVGRWNGNAWEGIGSGDGIADSVHDLKVLDLGSGPTLYASGNFQAAGTVAASNIAKWDGVAWAPLGSGINPVEYNHSVGPIMAFDDGSGPALYAAGFFTQAGGVSVHNIARWDGINWSAVGEPRGNGSIGALAVFDDGSGTGPALYAGGTFTIIGGVGANHLAKWDGQSWSEVGGGTSDAVSDFYVFDDGLGSGPALFVTGSFTSAGGVSASKISKWNGKTWSALGSGLAGLNAIAGPMIAFDRDGAGPTQPALYVGGRFTDAGGVPVNHIAKWNGSSWSDVAGGVQGTLAPGVFDFAIFDSDGSGPKLYAVGQFTMAGGVSANRIAAWNGIAWSALSTGVTGHNNSSVGAAAVFDPDGEGASPAALYVGGSKMHFAGGTAATGVARWSCPVIACPADIAPPGGNGVVNVADLLAVISAWGACPPPNDPCSADLNGDGAVNVSDLLAVISAWGPCP